MRRLNLFLVAGMLLSFLAHGITGSLGMSGANIAVSEVLSYITLAFTCAHVLVTLVLTGETLYVRHRAKAGYLRGNGMFWARRISGLAIVVPLVMHLVIFSPKNEGAYRLTAFTRGRMISQILLVLAVALHAFLNIRPVLIALGIRQKKAVSVDVFIILAVLLLLFGAAFFIYYMRWMAY